ncbi:MULTISPECIES: hypothetical protein [Streptomyces]|uniref:hypothetical protein n=1 Tax=Streptomyces TaxID=1883 RepID=UPI001318CAC6|nr:MULTISPECIES: hypothetical protein [Streptomyces]QGZ51647.1 hypothetical protein GPZ77_27600 [Streptomyces sp. QHH-9511]GGU14720.1 hypothetical protein GCM10010272_69600 [Streptomyces lateritius]
MRRDEDRSEDNDPDPRDPRDSEKPDADDRHPALGEEAWRRFVLGVADAAGPLLIILAEWWART